MSGFEKPHEKPNLETEVGRSISGMEVADVAHQTAAEPLVIHKA